MGPFVFSLFKPSNANLRLQPLESPLQPSLVKVVNVASLRVMQNIQTGPFAAIGSLVGFPVLLAHCAYQKCQMGRDMGGTCVVDLTALSYPVHPPTVDAGQTCILAHKCTNMC